MNFFWSGDLDSRDTLIISWHVCCHLKSLGGSGLKDLAVLYRSLILKRCWDMVDSSSLVVFSYVLASCIDVLISLFTFNYHRCGWVLKKLSLLSLHVYLDCG